MADQQGAALPWATAGQEEEQVERDVLARIGVQVGRRVEVKWQLEHEEGKEPTTKWWGAVVDSRVEGEQDGEGRQAYLLRYDADPDSGYEEQEVRKVTFLEEHYLYDISEDDELAWRRDGEAWDEPAAAAEDEDVGPEGHVYTLEEIAQAIQQAERRRGRTVEQESAEALSAFPQEQRLHIANGFRDFTDHITAAISKLAEQHGPGYVVTEADVKAATQNLVQQLLRNGA